MSGWTLLDELGVGQTSLGMMSGRSLGSGHKPCTQTIIGFTFGSYLEIGFGTHFCSVWEAVSGLMLEFFWSV